MIEQHEASHTRATIAPSADPLPPAIWKGVSIPFTVALLVVAIYAVWLFSMPCFPTTDGPVHMYYIHVLGALLAHNNPEYAHYFHIRHLLPPYSLYYYALLVLSQFMPMLLADRIVICVYFVSFVFGFRYLARAIGPSADLMTLLATLLLLNWPLGMGFVNFCLSLSFSFWATGLWLRIEGTRNLKGRIIFLIVVTTIMLTHPVPLLLLLTVTGVIFCVRLLHASRGRGGLTLPAHGRADLVTWGLAALNLGYVKLFAAANPLKQVPDPKRPPYWTETIGRVGIYGREHALAFLLGRSPSILLYRTGLLLILILPILMAIQQRRRNRVAGVWTASDTFLLLGGMIFVILPFIPSQLNGLYYFADRLVICVWLVFLFAACGWSARAGEDVLAPSAAGGGARTTLLPGGPLPVSDRAAATACIALALVSHAGLLLASNRLLRPAAEAIHTLANQALLAPGQVGFVVEDPRTPDGATHEGVSWNPFYWATVHAFRHNDAVLANAPWKDESIIPVAPSDALPEMHLPALQYPFPVGLQDALLAAPAQLKATLQDVTFFIVTQQDRPALNGPEPLLQPDFVRRGEWTCTFDRWYRLCRRNSKEAQQP